MKLNENQKVTLTLGQLKRLVKESSISDYDITDYGEEMFPPDDDFEVKAREIRKKWDENIGLKITKEFCQDLMFTLGRHIATGRISKEEVGRLLDDTVYADMRMSDLYAIFWEGVENAEAAVAADIANKRK